MIEVPSGSAASATELTVSEWARGGYPRTALSASRRHTRTVQSELPETITRVPSGNAPTATQVTRAEWPRNGPPIGAPSASRDTPTLRAQPPGTRTGGAPQRLPERGAVCKPRPPHRAAPAAGDDDRGAVGQRADRHASHQVGVAA